MISHGSGAFIITQTGVLQRHIKEDEKLLSVCQPESRTTPAQNQENLSRNVKTPTKQTDTSLTGLVFTDVLCETTSAKTIEEITFSFRVSFDKPNPSGIVDTVFFTMLLIYFDVFE